MAAAKSETVAPMQLLTQHGIQSVFLATGEQLISENTRIQFPGFQRDVNVDHVAHLVAQQKENLRAHGTYVFSGSIVIGMFQNDPYCLDGQHRYHAIIQLLQESAMNPFRAPIRLVVEVIQCRQRSDLRHWFIKLNQGRAVPEVLLIEDDEDRRMIVDAAANDDAIPPTLSEQFKAHLLATYAVYLSPTNAPHRPNINRDAFHNTVMTRYDLPTILAASGQTLVEWLEQQNALHGEWLDTVRHPDHPNHHENYAVAWERIQAKKGARKFYLGCYWLDTVKNTVSKALRIQCWQAWLATLPPGSLRPSDATVACPCCERERISAFTFHAGHRVSFRNGGSTQVSNLIPLCATCNIGMGPMNYDEYYARNHVGDQ